MSKHQVNYMKFKTDRLSVTLTIFLPVLLETALGSLYNAVDMMMVGKYDAGDGLSAIGLTSSPLSIFLVIFSAVNVGTTTLVAWNVGAKKTKDAQNIIKISLILNLFLGILMTVFGMLMAKPIVRFMGGEPNVQKLAIEYYNILVVGTTAQALTYSVTAAMRGAGYSRIPMIYNSMSNLLNVFGNYILIYGKFGLPAMGVIGAGYSTLISRIICCIWALLYVFFAKKTELSLKNKYDKFHFNMRTVQQMLRIGIPSAVESLFLQCGGMVFARIVNQLGKYIFSANQICNSINALTAAPSTAISVTANTMIGQYIGAGEIDKAKNYKKYLCRVSVILSVFMAVFVIIFSKKIIGLYAGDDDVEIIKLATPVFYIIAIQYLTLHYNCVISGALRGAGDTQFTLFLSVIGYCAIRIPLAYLFGIVLDYGLTGIWVSLLAHSWINTIAITIRYNSGKWLSTYHKINGKPDETKPA